MSDRVNLVALGLADVDLLQTIQNAAFGSHSIAFSPTHGSEGGRGSAG